MAQESFSKALQRLTCDPSFSESLKKDPKSALDGLALTSAELRVLREVDPDQLSLIVDALANRVRSGVSGTNACVGM